MRHQAWAAVLAVGWLGGTLLASQGCQTDVQSGIESANDLLYHKKYVEAERLYRKLLKRLDGDGKSDEETEAQRLLVLDRLGKINSLYLHDYNQAVADYEALVRRYPKSDQGFAARATVADIYHHKLGNLQGAIAEYQRLVSEFPERLETRRAQLQIVAAYFQLKNYEQARTEAEALIDRWPETSEAAQARFQIANSYYVQRRYAEAIATYERLLEAKPEPSMAALVLFELGNCFQELGEAERALSYYYACLSHHPNPSLVQRKIQRVRNRLHRTAPASSILQARQLQSQYTRPAGQPAAGAAGAPDPKPKPSAVEIKPSLPDPETETPEEFTTPAEEDSAPQEAAPGGAPEPPEDGAPAQVP